VQVGGDDHVQGLRFQRHHRGHRIDQDALRIHPRIVSCHFVEDFVPQHHAVALGIGLGHQRQVPARSLCRQLESVAVDAFHAAAGEHRSLGGDFCGQPLVHAAAGAGIFSLRVFADDHPVYALAVPQRALHAGEHPRRAHIGVLVEALADGQAQAPQRDMVGHLGAAHGAEENGVEPFQFLQAAGGNVIAVLQVVVAAPGKALELEFEALRLPREGIEDLDALGDDFLADAVAGDGRYVVGTHDQIADATAMPTSSVLALPPRSGVRGPSTSTFSIARRIAAPASAWPRCSSIIAPDQIWPIGLAIFLP